MQLDYLVGRAVEHTEEDEDGWSVVLEGGAQIVNENPGYELPDGLAGLWLTRVTLSQDVTHVYFGDKDAPMKVQMRLAPTEYAVIDDDGSRHYPQRIEIVTSDLPEDPSPDRVVDGPSEEWIAAQQSSAVADEEAGLASLEEVLAPDDGEG